MPMTAHAMKAGAVDFLSKRQRKSQVIAGCSNRD
ncbi:hypothetical protein [Sphingomonas panacis]